MIKPILIPNEYGVIGQAPSSKNLYEIIPGTKDKLSNKGPDHMSYDIILIDTEAEIVEESYYFANQGIRKCIRINKEPYTSCPYIHLNRDGEEMGDFHTWKNNVVAISKGTTSPDNIELDLPQLSPQSIQALFNYYNEHKALPESVETCKHIIDCEASHDGDTKYTMFNRQDELDITIPEVDLDNSLKEFESLLKAIPKSKLAEIVKSIDILEEPKVEAKTYTEEEIISIIDQVESDLDEKVGGDIEYCGVSHYVELLSDKFNSNKK